MPNKCNATQHIAPTMGIHVLLFAMFVTGSQVRSTVFSFSRHTSLSSHIQAVATLNQMMIGETVADNIQAPTLRISGRMPGRSGWVIT